VFHEIAGAIRGPSRYHAEARKASARTSCSSSRPTGRARQEGFPESPPVLEVSVPAARRPRSPREGFCAAARPRQTSSRVEAGEVAREHDELAGQRAGCSLDDLVRVVHSEEPVHRRPAVQHGGTYELVPIGCRDGHRHYDHAQHFVRDGLLDEVSDERMQRVCVTHFAALLRTVWALRGPPVEHGEGVDGFRPWFAEPAEEPVRQGVGLGREEVDRGSPVQGLEEACYRRPQPVANARPEDVREVRVGPEVLAGSSSLTKKILKTSANLCICLSTMSKQEDV
jgi:hypothetical protein